MPEAEGDNGSILVHQLCKMLSLAGKLVSSALRKVEPGRAFPLVGNFQIANGLGGQEAAADDFLP